MPLQQVSQRASQRDLWYIFSASQGSPAFLPALLPACLACLLVKFIKYLCGSCLHSFHLAFTYSLSLSLAQFFPPFFSSLLAVHRKIAGMLNP